MVSTPCATADCQYNVCVELDGKHCAPCNVRLHGESWVRAKLEEKWGSLAAGIQIAGIDKPHFIPNEKSLSTEDVERFADKVFPGWRRK